MTSEISVAAQRDMTIHTIARIVEAIVFASPHPVTIKELLPYIKNEEQLPEIIEILQHRYDENSALEFEVTKDRFAFRTRDDVTSYITIDRPVKKQLSRAALEVLAILAYHQPITRSEIEEIRGISLSRGTIDILLELEWIKPIGRRRTPGRPLTWGTSPKFLDYFGMASLDELPGLDELKSTGLLRKGQVLGDLGENISRGEDRLEPNDELSETMDFLDE